MGANRCLKLIWTLEQPGRLASSFEEERTQLGLTPPNFQVQPPFQTIGLKIWRNAKWVNAY